MALPTILPLTSVSFIPTSSGAVTLPSITNNGDGSVTIGTGVYYIHDSYPGESHVNMYTVAGGTFTLVDAKTNFIYVDYNNGSPILRSTTVRTDTVDTYLTTKVPVFTIERSGTILTILDWDTSGCATTEKMLLRWVNNHRFERDETIGGLILADSGSLHFTISAGTVWYGVNNQALLAVDSATDTVKRYLWNGSAWSASAVTTFENTYYQGATGLVAVSTARYCITWVYRSVQSGKVAFILLGTADYKLAEAQAAPAPSNVPAEISSTCVLVGRIITLKGATSATEVDSAFVVQFTSTGATNHNDLAGRADADCHPASSITNTPAGSIAAATVQAALNELDTEKVPTTRTITVSSPLTGSGNLSSNLTISIPAATATTPGYATAAQIAKLDGIEANANNYVLPTATSTVLGGVKPDGVSILNVAGVLSVTPASIGAAPAGAYLTKLAKWRMRRGL